VASYRSDPKDPLPEHLGPLPRTGPRAFGRTYDRLHVVLEPSFVPGAAKAPMLITLRSASTAPESLVRAVPPTAIYVLAAVTSVVGVGGGDLWRLAALPLAAAYHVVKQRLGRNPTLTLLVGEDDTVESRTDDGRRTSLERFDRVVDAECANDERGSPSHVALSTSKSAFQPTIDPRARGLVVDDATLTALVFFVRLALGKEPFPLRARVPGAPLHRLASLSSTTAAPMRRCPHRRDTLTKVAGPLDLERCGVCRGALLPAHQAQDLVENRLHLTKPDLDDLAALFGGAATECVACGGRARPVRLRGVYVELCRQCGAIWLDEGEETAFLSLYGEGAYDDGAR